MQAVAVLLHPVAVVLLTLALVLQPVAWEAQPVTGLLEAVARGPLQLHRNAHGNGLKGFNKMKFEMVETLGFVKQCVHNVAILEGHKAHC